MLCACTHTLNAMWPQRDWSDAVQAKEPRAYLWNQEPNKRRAAGSPRSLWEYKPLPTPCALSLARVASRMEFGVVATGPPGKSQGYVFLNLTLTLRF